MDIQYREDEGKPHWVTLSHKGGKFCLFKHLSGNRVVKETFYLQLIGYIFSVCSLILQIGLFAFGCCEAALIAGEALFFLYCITSFCVCLSMCVRYEKNICIAFDCDFFTQLQRKLTLLPKRRCVICKEISPLVYEIKLSNGGQRRYIAKSRVAMESGQRRYAVHSVEKGFPFWTLREY